MQRIVTVLGTVLRSRLFQFFAIGLVVWALAPGRARSREREVIVDAAVVADATRAEQARLARPLTAAEKQRVMSELVADEVLFREGLRLGIAADDAMVRARIADRMRSHLASASPANVSVDEAREEAARQVAHLPMRIRLAVAFVSKDRPNASADADQLARSLAASPESAAPFGGDRAPIEALAWWREEDLARAAGAAVAQAAVATKTGEWSAPIASAWGFYVVRPIERRAPTLEEAMDGATAEVRRRKAADAVARSVARVAADYDITVHAPSGEAPFDPRSMSSSNDRNDRKSGRGDGVD